MDTKSIYNKQNEYLHIMKENKRRERSMLCLYCFHSDVPLLIWMKTFCPQIYQSSKPLRIGYLESDGYTQPSPSMARSVREVKALLEAAGHTVRLLHSHTRTLYDLLPHNICDVSDMFSMLLPFPLSVIRACSWCPTVIWIWNTLFLNWLQKVLWQTEPPLCSKNCELELPCRWKLAIKYNLA